MPEKGSGAKENKNVDGIGRFAGHRGFDRGIFGFRRVYPRRKEREMNAVIVVSLIVSILLFGYLLVVMFFPEKF